MMERVCIMGLGYIGLPTASLLATKGFMVVGVDIRPAVVDAINRGEIHIYEPDLDILVKSGIGSGRLVAAVEPAPADVFIIAVPTPVTDDHRPDISSVEAATRTVAPHLAPGALVILESTCPVGTTERLAMWLRDLRPDLSVPERRPDGAGVDPQRRIFLAYCPERVLPGQILRELVDNDRIVGGIDRPSVERARAFYRQFVNAEIFTTSARTAELAKLAENAYRDVNIAFANELSLICDRLDVNVWDLIDLANRHPRVQILQPGPGVGGHCIAVDPWFIVHSVPEAARLIRTAREVNDGKPSHVLARIREKVERFKDPVIACLGLTYKAGVGDWRESPALAIIREMAVQRIGRLLIVEPYVERLPEDLTAAGVPLVPLEEAVRRADIIVLLVNHRPFADVDRELLKEKVVIDTRGMWR